TRLGALGVAVLGVHPPGDDDGARTLRRWGVEVVLPADADEETVGEALSRLATAGAPAPTAPPPPPAGTRPGGHAAGDEPDAEEPDRERGSVVVVWGPPGSPGRTTVAVNLAAELAGPSRRACLVDADTHAAS